jgi:hypothetical protein
MASATARLGVRTRRETRWSSRYVVPMNRAWLAGVCLLIGGGAAQGCGGTNSATTTTISGNPGTALRWLSSIAEPWNHKLNGDQQAIDTASAASSGSGAAAADAYFARLGAACSQMVADTGQAQNISRAPSAALDQAWRAMVAQTKQYASDCLTLTHTHSNTDLSTWNNSLKTMDTANAAFNAQVAVIHPPAANATG